MSATEVNFDGLIGPTHNYSGLSYGNLASSQNKNQVSFPRKAALEGLEKMRLLAELGAEQAILPPHPRPDLPFLRSCGFHGSNDEVVKKAFQTDPILLAASYSAAAMWTANAATVSPSCDTADSKLHLTPANLLSGVHRSLESKQTYDVLDFIFSHEAFVVHQPLPPAHALSDEGAANHMRVCPSHGGSGLEVFVYGRDAFASDSATARFPARQTMQASQSIARNHGLDSNGSMFVKQNRVAIDHGAFHNDVVAVANENVLFCHQDAFDDQVTTIRELSEVYQSRFQSDLCVIEVDREQVPLQDAVSSYLFNSQLVTVSAGKMVLVAAAESKQNPKTQKAIEQIIAEDNPISNACFPDVRQSMMNGGGPACLRLRIVMNDNALSQMHQGIRFTNRLYEKLTVWIKKHYREQLAASDLSDPKLIHESHAALFELAELLELPTMLLQADDA